MSKRDELMKGLANVRESMGDYAPDDQAVRGAPLAGPKATPAHLVGVVRSRDASQIRLDRIDRDPSQPRDDFDADALQRLADSLRKRGQLQPVRVRWDEPLDRYVIVCGERRWRAAKLAGLESLACVVVEGDLSAHDRLAVQLVENALREDLRPIEQARAYRSLMDSQGWSARQLAGELAIHHAQVVRALALLELPPAAQEQVEQGALSPAAAYEATKLDDPSARAEMIEQAVADKLTRQQVIEAVRVRKAGAVRRAPVEFRVGEGVTVAVRYRKDDRLTPSQALRLALKQAQALERTPEAPQVREEEAA